LTRLDLHLLGAPNIERDGTPITVDTRKAIALLTYLAVSNVRVTRDGLAALLWPDYDQVSARAALRRTLSTLRKALGDEALDVNRESVGFDSRLIIQSDVNRFRELVRRCGESYHSSHACISCISGLKEAVELYRGDFLAGFTLRDSASFDEWQFFQTEGLRRELGQVLETLTFCLSTRGEFKEAIAYARRWLSLDPLREDAHRQLMLLYGWAGERNSALRQYQECVRILNRELGVEPLEETEKLYQDILNHLLPPPPVNIPAPVPAITQEFSYPVQEAPSPYVYPLVGRDKEWEILQNIYISIRLDGRFLGLDGEAGIGKTRLADELISNARKNGAMVIQVRCYEGQTNLAYGPIVEALRSAFTSPECSDKLNLVPAHFLAEAARLVPELEGVVPGLPAAPPLQSPGAQIRFYEGVRTVLMRACGTTPPGILFIDDLHWADEATIDLIAYLIRRLPGHPLFILATLRTDSGKLGNRLRRLAAEAERNGIGRILQLHRLSYSDVDELVRSVSVAEKQPENFAQRLYLEAEGLPFFVIEYLNAVKETAVGEGQSWQMPGSVRGLLHSRLTSIDETAGQLLSAASVIGRSFDFDTLREASGRSEAETVSGLEELMAQGLIREQRNVEQAERSATDLKYDFTHEKIKSLVYDEISLARRRLLHRRVADALVNQLRQRRELDPEAATAAYHYQASGDQNQAANYFKLAGEYAHSLYANNEALSHFRSALDAGHPEAAWLHEAIGDLLVLTGEYSAALQSYREAVDLIGDEGKPLLERKRGDVYHRLGEWDLAGNSYQFALNTLGDDSDPGVRALLYADWGRTAHSRGNTEEALDLVLQALQLSNSAGDTEALAFSHNIIGILMRSQGNLEEATNHLSKSLELADHLGDPGARAAALNNLALVYGECGKLDLAIETAEEALEICRQQGDRHREAALLNNLADFFHSAGDPEKAMEQLKKAVVIFSEIGVEAGNMKAEIWKLSEW